MAGLKNIFPIDSVLAIKKSLLESVALTNGRHFLVKDLFDDKSDKNDDDQDDATYNDKFHGL
jgi:hypothetical protein